MNTPYYITTPIYYANAKIHFGNLYTSIIADVIARSKRLTGYNVLFTTGTDENGQKMLQVAQSQGKGLMEFLDDIARQDKEVMDICDISYTDFIRTTEQRHHKFVQHILQKTYESGDIYEGEYEGMYCIGCESFKKESDLIEYEGEKVCPDHMKKPEHIQEKNRFFRLSEYEDRLKTFYRSNPNFIQPQYRYNEILSFIENGLEDFSISRQGNTFGIPLPFDQNSVTYIRYDALLNYLTAMVEGYNADGEPIFKPHSTHMHHTLGKDIGRFHAIYWPAMLMAAGYEELLPQKEFIGGFFTVDGKKMSKSLGNTLYAEDLVHSFNRDAMVFYLLYDIPQGADGDFSLERLGHVYESMLMGGWGNLISRVTKLAQKHGVRKAIKHHDTIKITPDDLDNHIDQAQIQQFLQKWYETVQQANGRMQERAPWTKLKDETQVQEGIANLEQLLWEIKQLTLLSAPFLVNSFKTIQTILGNEELIKIDPSVNLSDTDSFFDLYERNELDLQLQPDVVYKKKEHN